MKVIKEELLIEVRQASSPRELTPGQNGYRLEMLELGLFNFLNRVSHDHTLTPAEDRLIRFNLAMKLLESFRGECHTAIIRDQAVVEG